jgi:sulfur relay (sulfurtransferase) DsrC/TusE family protein
MLEYSIRVDTDQNRIWVEVRGFATTEEMRQYRIDVEKALTKVSPGFTVLNDSSEFKAGKNEVSQEIEKLMAAVAAKGPSKVARIAKPTAGMQLSRISQKAGYSAATFSSIEDAVAFLDH